MEKAEAGLGKVRVEALSDGIFGVALTLLATHITDNPGEADVARRFVIFVVTFFNLGVYWVAHHNEFRLIRIVDRWLVWWNLLFLACVVSVPFATNFLWRDLSSPLGEAIYAINFVLMGLLLECLWQYAKRPRKTNPGGFLNIERLGSDEEERRRTVIEASQRNMFAPLCYTLTIVAVALRVGSILPVRAELGFNSLVYVATPLVYVFVIARKHEAEVNS